MRTSQPCHTLCLILFCRRDGFYLELLEEMPDIEDVVVAEEQRRKLSASHPYRVACKV